jgi:hypothetical protein
MEESTVGNLYQVYSLNVATYLKMNGFNIIRAEKIEDKTVFSFERTEQLYKAIDTYNSNEELKRFISTYKDIRNITRTLN